MNILLSPALYVFCAVYCVVYYLIYRNKFDDIRHPALGAFTALIPLLNIPLTVIVLFRAFGTLVKKD